LIQVVLSGQPELNVKLNRPELRQLAQRISIRRDIKPLSRDETERYIQYRLQMADYEGRSLFSRAARKLIWKYSQGVPRKINVVCGNALISGYALRKKTIGAAIIAEAIRDLRGQSSTKPSALQNGLRLWHVRGGRRVAIQFASVIAGILALTAGVLLANGWQRDAGLFRAAGAVYPLIQHPDRVSNPVAHQERPVRPTESTLAERPAVDTPKAPVAATLSRDLQYDAVSFLGGPHELLASGQTEFRIQSVSLPRVAPAPRYQDAEGEGPAHAEQQLCDIECIRSSLRKARTHTEQRPIDEAPPIGERGERVGPADQQAGENLPPARKVEEQSNNRPVRSVIVKASDILSKIIMETYGRYDPDLLRAVLEENPEIRNPDRIAVGQAIRLPIL
jgi:nucleoid-associated protein YgaU